MSVIRNPGTVLVRDFETIEELRRAAMALREVYNMTWLMGWHGFVSPT